MQFPSEIIYVQKLHFFTFLVFGTTLAALLAWMTISSLTGLLILVIGWSCAYMATLLKQTFIQPDKLRVTRSIARSLSTHDLSPRNVAIVATQMFYVLGDLEHSELLLTAYLNGSEPLVHSTLADIYLQQGKNAEALACLGPVASQDHPVVHWMFGRAFMAKKDLASALKHLEQAWEFISAKGLPVTGTGLLNNLFIQWSIKSSLLHSMAECYHRLGNGDQARRHRRLGNRFIIDPRLRCREPSYKTSLS